MQARPQPTATSSLSTRLLAGVVLEQVAAILGFGVLLAEIALLVEHHEFDLANFFSYFTIQTNFVLACSLALSSHYTFAGRHSRRLDMLKLFAVAGAIVTSIAYSLFPANGGDNNSLNIALHYWLPALGVVAFVINRPARTSRRTLLMLSFYPLIFVIYSLIRGGFTHWYPYAYVDPREHSYLFVILTGLLTSGLLAGIMLGLHKLTRARRAH